MNYSVLQTVYKSDNPEYFRLSLQSIIDQTIQSDDIVIVKDGPITDDLNNILNEFQNRYSNIHAIQLEKNMGLGFALNEGIKNVKMN